MKKTNALIFLILLCICIMGGCYANGDDPKPGETATDTQAPALTPPQENPSLEAPQNSAPPQQTPQQSGAVEQQNKVPDAQTDFAKLAPTTAMRFEELVGDNGDYAKVKEYPQAGTYEIVVNLYYQFITAYKKDANGAFTIPARYMICSTGSGKYPTPAGTFKMGSNRHRFSLFKTYNVYGQYWSQITRNIFFHSVLYSKKNAKTYTASSYKNLGRRVSHGCIRMLVPDARWIYYYAAPGTVVKIIKGKKDEAMAAIKKKLTRAALPKKRPDLKKGRIPVTEPWPGYKGPLAQK